VVRLKAEADRAGGKLAAGEEAGICTLAAGMGGASGTALLMLETGGLGGAGPLTCTHSVLSGGGLPAHQQAG
jgi:hypothetical protein